MKINVPRLLYEAMKFTLSGLMLQCVFMSYLLAEKSVAQKYFSVHEVEINVDFRDATIIEAFRSIESQTDFFFTYDEGEIGTIDARINVRGSKMKVADLLLTISEEAHLHFKQVNHNINVNKVRSVKRGMEIEVVLDGITVGGRVISAEDEQGIPGVNVIIKGTAQGTVTDMDGNYSIDVPNERSVLVFSSVGFMQQEVVVGSRTTIDITMESDVTALEEIVVVGYGTQKKKDVTGAIYKADLEPFREAPNTSILQSLQGSVPGLYVGQTTTAGEDPDFQIRGKSTIAGNNTPLIVLDGIIFRGSINDINPANIASVDVLKDASAAAIYGAQASNGVIIITSKSGKGAEGKPVFNYSGFYAFQSPVKELPTPDTEGFIQQTAESDIFFSRTAASGYLEPDPTWDIATRFSDNSEVDAYNEGRSTNWYDVLMNDNMYTQQHNLSMSNSTRNTDFLIALGYFDQKGLIINEGYDRLTARINVNNTITDWLQIGVQTFATLSDFSGAVPSLNDRYIEPYATDLDAEGNRRVDVLAGDINPLVEADADDLEKRLNVFGKIYAQIDVPWVEGLSYKFRFGNNYRRTRQYRFRPYGNGFTGSGYKRIQFYNDWLYDNIVTYSRQFADNHQLDVTLVYGREENTSDFTQASAASFTNDVLGYNNLGVGSSELQEAASGAWDESSVYSMARIFYGFRDKYLVTGTVRRDGYSGFGENNKFGVFPTLSLAWRASEEAFLADNVSWMNDLKLRTSYGTTGNRTIGRYQTLARVQGGFNYIDINGTPQFTQAITSLPSPNLKWEKTTGWNFGLDFSVLDNRLSGSIDYYDNNTTDLFYRVDIPAINRFTTFPDNLGRLHNKGFELMLTSVNMRRGDFEWTTTVNFWRNRNELKELIGLDADGDGVEDDLVSEGLFIGESIDVIFDYKIDGKWQLDDEIPSGFDVGAHKPVDLDGDGEITPNDRTIIGNSAPSYQFGIQNSIRYKQWSFTFFINSVQGGKNMYLGRDNYVDDFSATNSEMHFRRVFPEGIDYWTPENPDGRYQRPGINVSGGLRGRLYAQRSFARLQDIAVAYRLPNQLTDKLGLQNLKVYVSGKNLVTLTDWNGWDPETNQTIIRDGRPVLKAYTIGLDVQF